MKLMRSDAPAATAGHRPRSTALADRPTFSLALTLPVEWQPLAEPPGHNLLGGLEHANAGVLATLLKSADLGAPPTEDEALADALAPLRAKLDMIVDMLARISYRDQALPERRDIELGLNHIMWSQAEPVPADSWMLSKLYFHEIFREPVVLAGRLKSCLPRPGGDRWDIDVELADMSEEVSESFARLVFLEHRRQLGRPGDRHGVARRRG
jgi:hypothetical protein